MEDFLLNTFPAPVKAKLYQHQWKAFCFALWVFGLMDGTVRSSGVALLMEMGCGKTMVAIALIGALYQHGLARRVLIVCPLSLVDVWQDEFSKFADFPYQITVLKGSTEKKKQTLRSLPLAELQIVIVNYESTWRMEQELLDFNADICVADEAHKLKDNRSKQSAVMHKVGDAVRYRMLLTGTLITNKEIDVFSQYRFLDKRIFGTSFYKFRGRYFDMLGYGNHTPVFKKYMLDDFEKHILYNSFRCTKEECLDLPEIQEKTIKVELEPKTMKMYKQLEEDNYTKLGDGEVTITNILAKCTRMSQLTGGFLTSDEDKSVQVSKAKLEALEEIINSALADDQKLVVIARFKPELDEIQALLEKKKIGHAVIRGGVKDREEEIRRFQNDPDCMVFVGQIAAAGLGITLTASHIMVFHSMDYSMANFDQAKARIHRVGQKNKCLYLYLIAKGTVDNKVLRSLRNKVDLAKMLMDDYRQGKNPYKD